MIKHKKTEFCFMLNSCVIFMEYIESSIIEILKIYPDIKKEISQTGLSI
ncbi:hypothetical protein XCR1_970012 [Xenorhabdus cabanillasii JM26]|uniref:Uncharacterized protein n=1 Tax=Xenorhabdus cabanillasii JM26 TaxID=1427517 RepID=W1JC92_9GAMM|nr:hypothetical protein XCR1_970012 [Xenorhabdus cabanillasii JM26]